MKFTIEFTENNVDMLRAVMICTAGKNEVRYTLQGLHINSEDVVATDGSRIAKFATPTSEGPIPENGYIIPSFKIPVGTRIVRITIDGDNVTVEKSNKRTELTTEVYKLIDGTYPQYRNVIPERVDTPLEAIAFNAILIADIQKSLKSNMVKYEFTGAGSMIYVEMRGYEDLMVGVMPGRL